MEYRYEGHSLKSGIYKIINKLNGKIYVGSAKLFKVRWSQHSSSLRNQRHSNKFLQSDYNKCGEEAFVFEVLEVTEGKTKEERLMIEEGYIKQYYDHGDLCYNLCDLAISREGTSSTTPEETKAKISTASKKAWKNEGYREAHVARMKERWNKPGEKEKLSSQMKDRWQEAGRKEKYSSQISEMWTDPNKRTELLASRNTEEYIEGFKQRCHTIEARKKTAQISIKNHGMIISPEGEVVEVVGLKAFCEMNGLPSSAIQNIHHVINGKIPSYHGWRKYTSELVGVPYVYEGKGKTYALLSPTGELYTGANIAAFCLLHDLQQQNIVKVLLGKRKSHKGWKRAA
jgi:group I intron endonuclease